MANNIEINEASSVTNPVSLLSEFFAQTEMESRLKVIAKERISGWENWLQVELSCFFHQRLPADKGQWWREYPIRWDGMPSRLKFAKPDFWLWSGVEREYHLIELKQSTRADDKALEGVQGDINKLKSLTGQFYGKRGKGNDHYTCASKMFVLVSQWETCEEKALEGVTLVANGAIGQSGWYWVVYRSKK
ncbi:hypothetical protein [Enterovibrio norvegicus]|uniref:hypothetical protein n=1 Tax=Enterovibrio norvegicus TaxID=188144 RepID=UPI000C820509|nr:hypothetical protein [Enterovibrio norvegicus]MCC4799629.1 hypothetical protein [Enterovibrio norvegicus]PML77548.1 hypothetical protein BCT69_18940 [Enterovibrio norvegicus]